KIREWANKSSSRSAIILRPAVVYGPGNQANMLSLVDAIDRGRFFLIGKNDNVKSLISLRNLVAAVNHLLSTPLLGTHVFYLTDRESLSVTQIAGTLAEILQRDRPPRRLPLSLAKSAAFFGDLFIRLTEKPFPLTSLRLKALLENTH